MTHRLVLVLIASLGLAGAVFAIAALAPQALRP